MDLSGRPDRPRPAGWVIAEFDGDGRLRGQLYESGRVWDDEAVAAAVVERHDSTAAPLVLYALVPAWGPIEEPTTKVR